MTCVYCNIETWYLPILNDKMSSHDHIFIQDIISITLPLHQIIKQGILNMS